MEIHGNLNGIRDSIKEELNELYDYKMQTQEFASVSLIEEMARLTDILGKEISVFLSRGGKVLDVSVGDDKSVKMPYMRMRRGFEGVSGVRSLHTHPNGSPMLSEVDIGTVSYTNLDVYKRQSLCR